jgi:hypothetical protein
MFARKNSTVVIVGIILVLCGLAACGLSKEKLSSLDSAVQQKLQMATQIFESGDIRAVANYCEEKRDSIEIRGKNFTIFCSVTANLYKPEEDVVRVEGNKTILPISIYLRLDRRSIGFLDEGYLYRNTTISAFAWEVKAVNPTITKRKDFN